jgi:Ca2+/H+ antiporter, TMEM165/GDT1 family
MVEALTIVLAAGVSRGWRSALTGAAVAIAVLLVVIGVFGIEVLRLVPIDVLRVIVGLFLLLFGLKWLKKAILRQSGRKSLHAEDAIYAHQVESLSKGAKRGAGLDAEGFATAFNGTLLEGLEVALIIVAVASGTNTKGALGLAAAGAAAAFVIVGIAGAALRSPLSRVPENILKFVVGLMLTTFGAFWAGEGIGIRWPGGEVFVLVLLAALIVYSVALTAAMRRPTEPGLQAREAAR